MLQYWSTCIDLEEFDSPFDPTEFAQIEEQAEVVTPEVFDAFIGGHLHKFTSKLSAFECAVFPDLDNPTCGYIYDMDSDIHYIFI